MNFPPGTVEALEPRLYQRVTAHGARMEVDFWRSIIMPLQSGLVAEVSNLFKKIQNIVLTSKDNLAVLKILNTFFQSSSALNTLLVLSRDDSTLPQLNVTLLKGLLGALMAHLKTVLKALFPERSALIGRKRKRCETVKSEPEKVDNIYQINYKQVC